MTSQIMYLLLFMYWVYIHQINVPNLLHIDIFLTPLKKIFPKKKMSQIDVINVNSGFSNFGCRNTANITIYREEEWVKVLIHELFHNLNLDFSTENIDRWREVMYEICGINSEI